MTGRNPYASTAEMRAFRRTIDPTAGATPSPAATLRVSKRTIDADDQNARYKALRAQGLPPEVARQLVLAETAAGTLHRVGLEMALPGPGPGPWATSWGAPETGPARSREPSKDWGPPATPPTGVARFAWGDRVPLPPGPPVREAGWPCPLDRRGR